MSLTWAPVYFGDWLRDTMHLSLPQQGAYFLLWMHCCQRGRLPSTEDERAIIVRIRVAEWRKIRAPVEALFQDDGTHKRVTTELEKIETLRVKRKIAGAKGGFHSAISRTKRQASASILLQHNTTNRIDNHNHKDISSSGERPSSLEEVVRKKGWNTS